MSRPICTILAVVAALGLAVASADARPGRRGSPSPFAVNPGLDVDHYDFAITLDPATRGISGTATLVVDAVDDDVAVAVIDLLSSYAVTAATVDGMDAVVDHEPNRLVVLLPTVLSTGDRAILSVTYHGTVDLYDGLGLGFSQNVGAPWIFSLDEPFATHSWLPVVEDVEDKATWSLDVTVPSRLVVAANGVEVAPPTEQDGVVTYHWATAYANSIYLLMVAIGDYVVLEETYVGLDGQTMPILTYTFEDIVSETESYFAELVPMIEMLAERFGEYPFIDEKYGHALYGFGGAMEHATLTSIDARYVDYPTYQSVIVHELGHQWFGDSVSPKSWEHIWLNESFATYIEALWNEANQPSSIRNYGRDLWSVSYDGTVYAEDPNHPFDDSDAIYDRGGRVLHMLRHELGDTVFFAGVRAYLEQYAGLAANTDDFRAVMESAAGSDLGWFFDQWIYAGGRPRLVTWNQPYTAAGDQERVKVYLQQVQPEPWYRLSVDVEVRTGTATARHPNQQVTGEGPLTVFDLPSPGGAVTTVLVDPDGVLLASIADNGVLDRSAVPAVHIAGDRRSGVGTLTVTLAAESDDDLSGYTLAWDVAPGTATALTGSPITVSYPSAALGDYWASYLPTLTLVDGDGNQIEYPGYEVRVYDVAYSSIQHGDINRDGVVNGVDLALISAARGTADDRADRVLHGDLDDDGDIDDDDVGLVIERFGEVLWVAQ